LAGCIDRGLDAVRAEQEELRGYVKDMAAVAATLDPTTQGRAERQQQFETLQDRFENSEAPIHQQMAVVMMSFVAGLFVGEDTLA